MIFNIRPEFEHDFLGFLKKSLVDDELNWLSSKGDFSIFSTHHFPLDQFLAPLHRGEFPREDHLEYLSAIFECGIEVFNNCSRPLQIYVTALYVQCEKAKGWSFELSSEFYFREIEREGQSGPSKYSDMFLLFLEWLHFYGTCDVGYDDYHLLLSWVLVARISGVEKFPNLNSAVEYLTGKCYTREDIELLSTSSIVWSDWLELSKKIPSAGARLDLEIERIIKGE